MVDPYLYLGPSNLLLVEPGPAEIFLNKDYMKELKRRAALMGGGPWADQGNPDNISDRDSNPFLSDAFKTLFHFSASVHHSSHHRLQWTFPGEFHNDLRRFICLQKF